MKYQNTITGAVIDVKSIITEGPWQAVTPASSVVEEQKVAPVQPKRKAAKKKDE